MVEKVDPESASYGEVPGTPAYQQRQMDAAPDIILKTPDPTKRRPAEDDTNREGPPSNVSVPETIISRVDSEPVHGEVPGTEAYKKRALDAAPDLMEKKSDESGNF